MKEFSSDELKQVIDGAADVAHKLRKSLVAEEIYVPTAVATSAIPYTHLTKAFQVHEAILVLCREGYGSEAMALSRIMLEMLITLRWITNNDQLRRAEDFAFFVAKRKEYAARSFAKYQPGNPIAADVVTFVENTYKQYADKYKSWNFWSNSNTLKELASEKENLIQGLTPPNDDMLMYYELFYSQASDYVHGTAMALDEAFPLAGTPYTASAKRESRHVFTAVIYATQWLLYIMLRVDAYRQLGLDEQIKAALSDFADVYHILDI
jgi:hypothetical protein